MKVIENKSLKLQKIDNKGNFCSLKDAYVKYNHTGVAGTLTASYRLDSGGNSENLVLVKYTG